MKKTGFTLTEVIITLGIIGIVAALVAPSLIQSGQNEANAARLATTVSNMENAFSAALAQEHTDSLYDTAMWANTGTSTAFYGELNRYLKLSGIKQNIANYNIQSYSGEDAGDDYSQANGVVNNHYAYETKNGALIFISPTVLEVPDNNINSVRQSGGALLEGAGNVIIDTNGEAGPNMIGRDIFRFCLSSDGVLYPYGSRDVTLFDNGNGVSAATANPATWDRPGQNSNIGCNTNNNGSISVGGNGEGCTARVVANGFKIDYIK